MLKRCSNCKHCKADMRAILLVGIHRMICFSHGHLVRSPFWEGWKCKEWEKEYYLGYSSYCIDNVLGWLKEFFEIVEAPKTNADRIRAMSDEELARHLHCIGCDCHLCVEHKRLDNEPLLRDQRCDENCFEHCLEWLKQPAEE